MSFTENSKLEENKQSLNFIEAIIEKDLQEGKNGGRIQTASRLSPMVICISDMQKQYALILALQKNTVVFVTFGSMILIL